jgi:5-methylcytosine-specific restriction endonuclease McrA
VYMKSSQLGIDRTANRGGKGKARSWQRGWEPWELDLLANPDISLGEVARQTGRTYTSVRHKVSRLGLIGIRDYWLHGDENGNSNWTEAEEVVLRDISLHLSQVAEMTGHSFSSCASKAHQLGIWRGRRAGAEHPKWVDGNYSDTYRGPDWREVRLLALERDGYTCQDCGFVSLSGFDLAVHHRIPWRLRQSNDLEWLVTLCRSCHSRRPEHALEEIPEDVLLVLAGRLAGGEQSAEALPPA